MLRQEDGDLMAIKQKNTFVIKIGFTSTQAGMTYRQYNGFCDLMKMLSCLTNEYHHGDCIGADEQFHHWVILYDNRPITIVIHPPSNPYKRAFCEFTGSIETRPEKSYLERNKDIVTEINLLVATPNTYVEVLRSGTWSTIREARRQNKPVYIVFPDGEITKNN